MLHSGIEIAPAFSMTLDLRDLPLALAVGAVLLVVEILLARRERWWPGLGLPLLWLLGAAAGLLVQADGSVTAGCFLTALLLENIPNLLLLTVYALCRLVRRNRTRRQLRKIQIDDL